MGNYGKRKRVSKKNQILQINQDTINPETDKYLLKNVISPFLNNNEDIECEKISRDIELYDTDRIERCFEIFKDMSEHQLAFTAMTGYNDPLIELQRFRENYPDVIYTSSWTKDQVFDQTSIIVIKNYEEQIENLKIYFGEDMVGSLMTIDRYMLITNEVIIDREIDSIEDFFFLSEVMGFMVKEVRFARILHKVCQHDAHYKQSIMDHLNRTFFLSFPIFYDKVQDYGHQLRLPRGKSKVITVQDTMKHLLNRVDFELYLDYSIPLYQELFMGGDK
jgi:hypothetical protein